jgi:hypothetical protein
MTEILDNPWGLVMEQSKKAGFLLADILSDRVQGNRPVTLIGTSLGARVIYFCLKALYEKEVFGIVEDVILMGCPVESDKWDKVQSVTSGFLINVYSSSDWVLALLSRTFGLKIAGLGEVENVINIDVTDIVEGHSGYIRLVLTKGIEIKKKLIKSYL